MGGVKRGAFNMMPAFKNFLYAAGYLVFLLLCESITLRNLRAVEKATVDDAKAYEEFKKDQRKSFLSKLSFKGSFSLPKRKKSKKKGKKKGGEDDEEGDKGENDPLVSDDSDVDKEIDEKEVEVVVNDDKDEVEE